MMDRDADLLLLATAVRSAFDPSAHGELARRWQAGPVERLPLLAERHRVAGVAWSGISAAGVNVPRPVSDHLRTRAAQIAADQLAILAQSLALQHHFAEAGIPLLFVKGQSLAALAYPHPHTKDSCDIDLLVHAHDLQRAAEQLSLAGYRVAEPADTASLARWHQRRKESVWVHSTAATQVDLHHRLVDNPGLAAGFDPWAEIQHVSIGNGASLPTLSGGPLYAYLCLHGASSAWFRLKWLADLAGLLRSTPNADLAGLHHFAQSVGAGHASGQALLLLQRYFAVSIAPDLAERLNGDRACRWLARIAQRQLRAEKEPTQRLGGTLSIRLSQALLGAGPAFGAGELLRQLGEIMSRR